MRIEDLWKELAKSGVAVSADVQRRIGLQFNQERVLIRPPAATAGKLRVIEYGTSLPAAVVARQVGVTVQHVRRVRRLLRA